MLIYKKTPSYEDAFVCPEYPGGEPRASRGDGFEPPASGLWARRASWLLYPAKFSRRYDGRPGYTV